MIVDGELLEWVLGGAFVLVVYELALALALVELVARDDVLELALQ